MKDKKPFKIICTKEYEFEGTIMKVGDTGYNSAYQPIPNNWERLKKIMKPKKLIREKIISKLKDGEFENITDLKELNKLYAIKVREELAEIQESDHKDIMEFVDLIQVAWCWAEQNGFTYEQVELYANIKFVEKGKFSNLVLNNLNPNNPSNKLYFENDL
jgi:predicted house-cleaning noncanonical NTP pyrophosphatase (MazG superfamily)